MSSRKKRKFPGPLRGTPDGDERVGLCRGKGCGAEVYRGDRFIVLVGEVLICEKCRVHGAQELEPLQTAPDS